MAVPAEMTIAIVGILSTLVAALVWSNKKSISALIDQMDNDRKDRNEQISFMMESIKAKHAENKELKNQINENAEKFRKSIEDFNKLIIPQLNAIYKKVIDPKFRLS